MMIRKISLVFAIGTILLCGGWTIFRFYLRTQWPLLTQIDPSMHILNEPRRLLQIAASPNFPVNTVTEDSREPAKFIEIDIRHEALAALMSLQRRRFGVTLKANDEDVGLDHVVVETLPSKTKGEIYLLATPAKYADVAAQEGSYWSEENLTFQEDGRLLKRTPYRDAGGVAGATAK